MKEKRTTHTREKFNQETMKNRKIEITNLREKRSEGMRERSLNVCIWSSERMKDKSMLKKIFFLSQ